MSMLLSWVGVEILESFDLRFQKLMPILLSFLAYKRALALCLNVCKLIIPI